MNEETKAATPLKQLSIASSSSQQLSAFTSVSGFELVQRMARGLMTATLIPKRYQESIGDTMIAINMAQRLGCDPLMVMQNLYVVHQTPAWSGQFVIAAINQSGMFKGPLRFVEVGKRDDMTWGFYAEATSKDGHVIKGPTVTLQLAKNEGWIAKNPKWVNMPEMMLRYRAGSWFGRTECPELLMGFQSAEEVNDTIDIDPETGEIVNDPYQKAPKATSIDNLKKATKARPDTVVNPEPAKAGETIQSAAVPARSAKDAEEEESPEPRADDGKPDPEASKQTMEQQLQEQGWYSDGNRKFNIHGEIWNTDVHSMSSKDGNPIVNSDGHFRVRRGGPLPGAEVEIIPEVAESGLAENKTPGYEPEPEFIDGPDNEGDTSAYDDWMEGIE